MLVTSPGGTGKWCIGGFSSTGAGIGDSWLLAKDRALWSAHCFAYISSSHWTLRTAIRTDKELERGYVPCHTISKWQSWDWNLIHLTLKPMSLTPVLHCFPLGWDTCDPLGRPDCRVAGSSSCMCASQGQRAVLVSSTLSLASSRNQWDSWWMSELRQWKWRLWHTLGDGAQFVCLNGFPDLGLGTWGFRFWTWG